jgi:hypothetical protein
MTIAVDVITFDVNSLNVSPRSLATSVTTKFRLNYQAGQQHFDRQFYPIESSSRNGHPPPCPKSAIGDFQAWGSLTAFEFGQFDESGNPGDYLRIETAIDYLLGRLMFADDRVQNFI